MGNPLENAQAHPRAPVLQRLRGPETGRGLPTATQLSKTPGTMEPKDSPLHATSHCQPGLEVPHKGNAGVWMLAGAPSAPAGLAVGTELNGRHCGLPSQS